MMHGTDVEIKYPFGRETCKEEKGFENENEPSAFIRRQGIS
jgi:uncharacterized protein Veg